MDSNQNTNENKVYVLKNLGELSGHNGWVTSIKSTADPKVLLSSSRDKTVIQWALSGDSEEDYGKPAKRLYGHEHFVQDVTVSSDARFALSGSWDNSLRLWDLETGLCKERFVGHKGDVMSVAFSADNRQICSGSRDRSVMLWNTLGQNNYTIVDSVNPDWISCVEFSPKTNPEKKEEGEKAEEENKEGEKDSTNFNFIVFGSFNGSVKKFDFDSRSEDCALKGHDGPVQAVSISPDASLCASGGKDGKVLLWDLKSGQELRGLELGESIVRLKFNPYRYWLCGVTANEIVVWDLVKDNNVVVKETFGDDFKCTSVEWAVDGETILCGFNDGVIRAKRIVEDKGGNGDVGSDHFDVSEDPETVYTDGE